MSPDQLIATLKRLGLSQSGAARILEVDPRTVRRWVAGDGPIPKTVEMALLWIESQHPAPTKKKPAAS